MFAVSRFAHYLKCMVRDKIGATKEKERAAALAAGMDHAVCRRRSGEFDASRPRRASRWRPRKVEVFEDEENPGYYAATFYLRPHFQLEGMDIGMSLVSRLPAQRSSEPAVDRRDSTDAGRRRESATGAHAEFEASTATWESSHG